MHCRAHDLLDPIVAYKCLPALFVCDKDDFHRPLRGGEDWVGLVGLLVRRDKTHVPRRDPDEGRHVVVAANCGRAPRGVFLDRENQDHWEGGVLHLRRGEGVEGRFEHTLWLILWDGYI